MGRRNTKIQGLNLIKATDEGVYLCYIEEFTDELKDHIRKQLSSIWHGAVDAEERKQFDYYNTLNRFLERYNSKTEKIKKGMIGELLTHLLVPQFLDLSAISVMKNKEEASIRKGFDVVYYDDVSSLWYCEVKAGGDNNKDEKVDKKNTSLLSKAKADIKKHTMGNRSVLWDSVLVDVNSTIFNSKKKVDIKKLLDEHHPDTRQRDMGRNVVLSSVLYTKLDNKIDFEKLKAYKVAADAENVFVGLIVLSIQKPTYTKIQDFLVSEVKSNHE